jgi:hypothetical protein
MPGSPMRILRALALMPLLAAACSRPRDEDVRAEFLRARPDARVASLEVGEGDGDHVYYHVRFRTAADTSLRETIWLYARQPDGLWRNTHRGPASAVRP